MPLAGTIAVVTFVGAYVPFVGAWVAGGFAVLIALGTGSTSDAPIMAVVALLANGVLQQMIQPFVMGATLSLNPLVVLVVTIGGGCPVRDGRADACRPADLRGRAHRQRAAGPRRRRAAGQPTPAPSGRTLGRTPSAALPCHRAAREPPSRASGARPASLSARIGSLVRAIEENDEARIEEAILRLSRSRRVFAPLAFAVGAFAMLFDGLRLLVSNWRLTLVQILPAMWIWLAMFDLKAHVLHGKSFNVLRGPVLIPIILVIVAITVGELLPQRGVRVRDLATGRPEIRPAVAQARRHLTPILVSGAVVGLLLALSTTVVTRWGRPWFTLSLGIVVGVMMVCYVAVPSRLIGVKPTQSRRDKLSTTVVGGVLGATVCTPPYILGRLGILMLGSSVLLIPGIVVLALGVTLQAGATGAVRAIKMSASLTGSRPASEDHP